MSPPVLPPAGPLTGDERATVVQGGRARWTALGAIRDWILGLMPAVIANALAPVLQRVSALEAAGAAQSAKDAAQDAALQAEVIARQAVSKAVSDEAAARQATDTAQAGRIATLEAKPEEVAHFTGASTLPAITLGGTVALVVTVTPARAGDALAVGEDISVQPATALPAGLSWRDARVTAANKVTIQLSASIAILAGQSVTWNVSALR